MILDLNERFGMVFDVRRGCRSCRDLLAEIFVKLGQLLGGGRRGQKADGRGDRARRAGRRRFC